MSHILFFNYHPGIAELYYFLHVYYIPYIEANSLQLEIIFSEEENIFERSSEIAKANVNKVSVIRVF